MEEKELWMNKLKEKLADYSEPTPASGWERLENCRVCNNRICRELLWNLSYGR